MDVFRSFGLDLDNKDLELAKELAAEENVCPEWICANAGDFKLPEPADIILCFDLLEHIDDETIRGMFKCIKANLKTEGIFLYHTFPTQLDLQGC